jgi:diguanylate cyclase (GGDEF)-like protein
MLNLIDSQPFPDFENASRAVLSLLHARLGFNLWMVTRTEKNDWIVLQSEDHGYGVAEGTVFRWLDSFCSQMVAGRGPRIAPNSNDVPAYADAPIGKQVQIAAYVGVPLTREDGSLFGTLCAIHPASQPAALKAELPLVELLGRLLSGTLVNDLRMADQARQIERLQVQAMTDGLTGLINRRGWDLLLEAEEARCRRYGHEACVLSIDLDGLKAVNDREGHSQGDRLIRSAAEAIRRVVREPDAVARIGGDEFSVLGVECDAAGGEALAERVRTSLFAAGVEASVGLAIRERSAGLSRALEKADQAMYESKRQRRQGSRYQIGHAAS